MRSMIARNWPAATVVLVSLTSSAMLELSGYGRDSGQPSDAARSMPETGGRVKRERIGPLTQSMPSRPILVERCRLRIRRFGLMLRLPFGIGHAIDDLAR